MNTVRELTTAELVKTIVESWEAAPPSILKVVLSLLHLLQHGRPVSPDELASATGLAAGVAVKLARRLGAEFDDEGNLVGWGLTLVPTPHKYRANGHDLYTWCAAVVSWSLESDLDNIRGSFCDLTHYFASRETAAQYVKDHPGLVIVSVDSVFEAASTLRELDAFKSLAEA